MGSDVSELFARGNARSGPTDSQMVWFYRNHGWKKANAGDITVKCENDSGTECTVVPSCH